MSKYELSTHLSGNFPSFSILYSKIGIYLRGHPPVDCSWQCHGQVHKKLPGQFLLELLSTLCRRQCRDNRDFSTVDMPFLLCRQKTMDFNDFKAQK